MSESSRGSGELFHAAPEKERMQREPVVRFSRTENILDEKTGLERSVEKKYVSVLGIELPVYEGVDGSPFTDEEFANFSKDEASLDLLKRYAASAKLNQPLLLEGVTDIGKSKALEYLAHLCNRRLYRLSFSGQTDVSEFVGKYVPNTAGARGAFESLLRTREKLSGESLTIIDAAREAGRSLSEDESKAIAQREGIPMGEDVKWIWQDGLIVKSMTHAGGKGSWLYLDELGSVEPQVIVKLNRIFEDTPRLEVAENGNRMVKAGSDFRIFASTNPPEYAGRNPFAPDFLRRFVYQKIGGLKPEVAVDRLMAMFTEERKDSVKVAAALGSLSTSPLDFRRFGAEDVRKIFSTVESIRESINTKLDAGDLLRDQRQKFRMEFSDGKRIAEFLQAFGGANIEQAFAVAMEIYVYGKFGVDDDRAEVKTIVETVMKGKNIKEVFKKFGKPESPKVSEARSEAERLMASLDIASIAAKFGETVKSPESDIQSPELREALSSALVESKTFFTSHKLPDFAKALPAELPPLSRKQLERLEKAREQGMDRMMILPADALYPRDATQRAKIVKDQLLPLAKYGKDPYEGNADAMHASEVMHRPESGIYILCYSSQPIPQETKGLTYPQLDELFKGKDWNGLTYQEYLLLQRLECEKRGEMSAKQHSFDGADNDAKKANWTWLLDSSAPAGRLRAYWNSEHARVDARVRDSTNSNPFLGARPAVIVRF